MSTKLPAPPSGARSKSRAEIWIRLDSFLSSRTPNTAKTYMGILREWSSFLGAELGTDKSAEKIAAALDLHAMAYLKWLGEQRGEAPRMKRSSMVTTREIELASRPRAHTKRVGLEDLLANATINKKLVALRRIYRMLLANGLIGVGYNPFDQDRLRPPPKDSGRKRPTEMVPFEKVFELIDLPDVATLKGRQDRAILACLFGGGLRRSEVLQLRLGDLRATNSGTPFLYLRSTKAGRDAQQALPQWAANAVIEARRDRIAAGAEEGDYLFCSFRGKGGAVPSSRPLSASGINKVFRHYCRRAGLDERFTPHSARATAITKLLSDGIPHREVQEFSRHSSVQMVELYDKRRIGVERNPGRGLDYEQGPKRKR